MSSAGRGAERAKIPSSNKITYLKTLGTFANGRACSDTLFHVLSEAFDAPLSIEERACMPLAGGILQHGYQCGMLWGTSLAAGARAHKLYGPGPRAEAQAILAAQRVVQAFRGLKDTIDCFDITHVNNTSTTLQMVTYFLLKGGTIGCFKMAATYAPLALSAIEAAFAQEVDHTPLAPVSCAARMARALGATDQRATMAAGLAGGIGLSGGACGALGTAIWLDAIRGLEGGARKVDWKSPSASRLLERFLEHTDYEFSCATISGCRFNDPADHAEFLQGGGCVGVIEALAAAAG